MSPKPKPKPKEKRVRYEGKSSICFHCDVQIGKGNLFEWYSTGPSNYAKVHPGCLAAAQEAGVPAPAQAPKPGKPDLLPDASKPSGAELDGQLADISKLLQALQAQHTSELAELRSLAETAAKQAKEALDAKPQELVVTVENGGARPLQTQVTNPHPKFTEALFWLERGSNIQLTGPQASGKSTIPEMIAESTGMPLYAIEGSPHMRPSDVWGFVDANGTAHKTAVWEAFEGGGVLLLEEFDNMPSHLQVELHAILDKRRDVLFGNRAFAVSGGNREHPLWIVATTNTAGFGGNINHAERRRMDSATKSRFAVLTVDYDEKLENTICHQIAPEKAAAVDKWLGYVRKLRNLCRDEVPELVVCMRASIRGAQAIRDGVTIPNPKSLFSLAEPALFSGLDADVAKRLHQKAVTS